MVKQPRNWQEELKDLQYDCGLIEAVDCTEAENRQYLALLKNGRTLPDGVHRYTDGNNLPLDTFYLERPAALTAEERLEYIRLLQLKKINTIKNCVIFLMIPAVMVTVLGLLFFISQIA